jgi:Domain of unknown function (DUF4190)/Protein of unknown function (DUF2510)
MSPESFGQTPPAGWYPDNSVDAPVGQQRYWDGSAWTERTTAPTAAPTTVQPTVTYPALAEPASIPARRTNVAAVVSLIFGILWIFWIGSLVAVVCGHVARAQIRRSGEAGDGAAIAGLILGYLGLTVLVLFWLLVIVGVGVGTSA